MAHFLIAVASQLTPEHKERSIIQFPSITSRK